MEPEENYEFPTIPEVPVIPEEHYERADAGKRFLNYFIDVALFYVLTIIVGMVYFTIFPPSFDDVYPESPGFRLGDKLFSMLLFATYMGLVESIFNGKSLGKLITKTRAVYLDGGFISTGAAFSRGFCRAVPFCALSAFGTPCNPWHDRWTDTMVIDETKTTYLQNP
ncbi:MAG TPA: RDD family protein [Saprospiraceae bacterium]|nr:RDD family protein [Saprospiraceae bacterium]